MIWYFCTLLINLITVRADRLRVGVFVASGREGQTGLSSICELEVDIDRIFVYVRAQTFIQV